VLAEVFLQGVDGFGELLILVLLALAAGLLGLGDKFGGGAHGFLFLNGGMFFLHLTKFVFMKFVLKVEFNFFNFKFNYNDCELFKISPSIPKN